MLRSSLAALCALFGCLVHAEDSQVPAPPRLGFGSYYLVDYATDRVLAESLADEQVPPASLTKLMTAYVVFKALEAGEIDLHEQVPVSVRAWKTGGTRMFIDVNSRVEAEDLIRGMLIQSGNDASVALAERVSGSVEAFVERMNSTAAALGMRNSVFRNPTGLPARGHLTTPHDLAIVAKAIIREFPAYYGLYSEREFSYNGITQHNRNALLARDPSVDGMKTGHTEAAGYCLVSSAQRDGMRLIAVVLGATTPKARNDGAQKLLEYGFANYETHKLYAAGQELGVARVAGGSLDAAGLGLTNDLYVTIPRGSYDAVAASMDVGEQLVAPLPQGTAVGAVNVSLGGAPLSHASLVTLKPVTEGGVWTKLVGTLGLE
ncbi:MAG TPA: D-alanyl-D-alanine carboxypeptidase family protein [Gammaproteobacteria bacterium]|nr:D-alanyl-D-alanine carboxypeptidase family protein [Gammaproteobacteria bacterium]